jgi:hypothetical protein
MIPFTLFPALEKSESWMVGIKIILQKCIAKRVEVLGLPRYYFELNLPFDTFCCNSILFEPPFSAFFAMISRFKVTVLASYGVWGPEFVFSRFPTKNIGAILVSTKCETDSTDFLWDSCFFWRCKNSMKIGEIKSFDAHPMPVSRCVGPYSDNNGISIRLQRTGNHQSIWIAKIIGRSSVGL